LFRDSAGKAVLGALVLLTRLPVTSYRQPSFAPYHPAILNFRELLLGSAALIPERLLLL
jgi:hypothetical protein